jgi:hypothetical protein
MRSFPIVMTVTGCCAPLTVGTIRVSDIKILALDTREAGLCATPDNSVNIERLKGQFKNNFCEVAVFRARGIQADSCSGCELVSSRRSVRPIAARP